MVEGEDSQGPERRDEGHDRWLAMQSAYAEYRRASEVLECTQQSTDDPNCGHVRLALLEGRHRTALETYLEARMEFLEFRFDEFNRAIGSPPASSLRYGEDSAIPGWLAFINRRPVLGILTGVLFCTIAFSLARESKHVRDLDAAYGQLRATVNQTRDGLEALRKKLEAAPASAQSSAIPQEQQMKYPATPPVQPSAAKRPPAPKSQHQNVGVGKSYNFSLELSPQFKRIGPIEVSVQAVDPRKKCAMLSIISGPVKMASQRVELNQPLWIKVGYQQPLAKLVVDRIAGTRIEGRLIGPQSDKADLITGQVNSNVPASPFQQRESWSRQAPIENGGPDIIRR